MHGRGRDCPRDRARLLPRRLRIVDPLKTRLSAARDGASRDISPEWSRTVDKIVLNLEDLVVDSFTTKANSDVAGIAWTGCMSECGAC
jgi:hypothetical protein